jgi:hypothetical protein
VEVAACNLPPRAAEEAAAAGANLTSISSLRRLGGGYP